MVEMEKLMKYSECFETNLCVRVEVTSDDPIKVKALLKAKVHRLLEEMLNTEYEHGEAKSAHGITWNKDF